MLGGSWCVLEWDMEEFSVAMGDIVDWTKKNTWQQKPSQSKSILPQNANFYKSTP